MQLGSLSSALFLSKCWLQLEDNVANHTGNSTVTNKDRNYLCGLWGRSLLLVSITVGGFSWWSLFSNPLFGNALQATGLRICCWEKVGRVRGVRDACYREKTTWTSIQTYLVHSSPSPPAPKPKSLKLCEELPNRPLSIWETETKITFPHGQRKWYANHFLCITHTVFWFSICCFFWLRKIRYQIIHSQYFT